MLFAVHVVAQAVADEQGMWPVHSVGVPATHCPVPLQLPVGVYIPCEQEAAPQLRLGAWKRQAPPVPHMPSKPHTLLPSTAHSASGSVPSVTSRQ